MASRLPKEVVRLKTLAFITLSRATYDVFQRQLQSFLKGEVRLVGHSLEADGTVSRLDASLFLLSSRDALPVVAEVIAARPYIVSRRTLDPSKMGPLFSLEARTRILVVNNAMDVAMETVDLLGRFGLDTLSLVPWWPGCKTDLGGMRTAVTPGFSKLVPSQIEKVLDIGVRPIDVSTLVEIALHLGLTLDGVHYATAQNFQGVVKLVREQADLLKAVDSSRKDLEAILNSVHDAVIMSDAEGRIKSMNRAAERMTGVKGEEASRVNLTRWFPAGLTRRVLSTGVAETNRLFTIGERKYLVTMSPVEDQFQRLVVTAREARSVEQARGDLARGLRVRPRAAKYVFEDIVGTSAVLMRAVNKAKKLAETDTTVFIVGETGTGKELFAHAIHNASHGREGPFIAQNIAALPEQLVQSELFGYESGAFTGASREGKPGLFELADGGTLFLDEIADISPSVQVSLLRVLQEREVTRVGGSNLIPVSVRVIAATNQDLSGALKAGWFRKDLYYRLCAFPLRIPLLRERPEDIPVLARHFVRKYLKDDVPLPVHVLKELEQWSWPGNVRELEELIKHAASVSESVKEFYENLEELVQSFGEPETHAASDDIRAATEALKVEGALRDFVAILECMLTGQDRGGIGRDALSALLVTSGHPLTPSQVRTRLTALHRHDLVSPGRGRRGTTVTPRGRAVLACLKDLVSQF